MVFVRPLLRQFISVVKSKQLKVVTAESCTGGMLAQLLTEYSGSSSWYDRGFITYSNAAKHDCLGVSTILLEKKGAVSLEVAQVMAEGALKASQAHIAIAITGIAGPSGGSLLKPVGWVCFGLASHHLTTQGRCVQFSSTNRQYIRRMSCCEALKQALDYISQDLR